MARPLEARPAVPRLHLVRYPRRPRADRVPRGARDLRRGDRAAGSPDLGGNGAGCGVGVVPDPADAARAGAASLVRRVVAAARMAAAAGTARGADRDRRGAHVVAVDDRADAIP